VSSELKSKSSFVCVMTQLPPTRVSGYASQIHVIHLLTNTRNRHSGSDHDGILEYSLIALISSKSALACESPSASVAFRILAIKSPSHSFG